jgi:hypothetical protein
MKKFADTLAQIMVLAGSSRGITKDLGCNNTTLADQLQEFCRLRYAMSIPVCCFFELLKTNYGRRFGVPLMVRGMLCTQGSVIESSLETS